MSLPFFFLINEEKSTHALRLSCHICKDFTDTFKMLFIVYLLLIYHGYMSNIVLIIHNKYLLNE